MIADLPLEEFLQRLASRDSTPGGGSAAGLMGAMGAALVSMVCHLTIGKPQYAEVEADMQAVLAEAESLRGKLTDSIADDVAAFDAVMAAYSLPKATEADKAVRTQAIQQSLRGAMLAPMACARLATSVIRLSRRAAEHGSKAVVSDAGVAVMAAYASLKSAALNVYINAGALQDQALVSQCVQELEACVAEAEQAVPAIYARVRERL